MRAWGGRVLLGILGLIAGASAGSAQVFESVGTRALGLGGAFVAVADDASAVYWNPAGLASGAFASFVADWGVAGTGDLDGPAPDEAPRRRRGLLVALGAPPAGLAYYRVTARAAGPAEPAGAPGSPRARPVTSLVAHHVAATLVQSLADGVHVGVSLKAVHGRAFSGTLPTASGEPVSETLDRAGELATGQTRFDLDAGLIVDRGGWRAGVTGRNLATPRFGPRDSGGLSLARQVRTGVAVFPTDRLTLAADADLTAGEEADGRRRSLAAGAEYWTTTGRRLAIRGGLRAQTVGALRTAVAAGLTWSPRRLAALDVAATIGGRQADRGFSVSARLLY